MRISGPHTKKMRLYRFAYAHMDDSSPAGPSSSRAVTSTSDSESWARPSSTIADKYFVFVLQLYVLSYSG